MLRLGLLILLVLAAAIWVEAGWNAPQRTLTLRVRQRPEIVGLLRSQARELGQRAIRAASEATAPAPAPVGASPVEAPRERLTRDDREALDRLIMERIREGERDTPAGAH